MSTTTIMTMIITTTTMTMTTIPTHGASHGFQPVEFLRVLTVYCKGFGAGGSARRVSHMCNLPSFPEAPCVFQPVLFLASPIGLFVIFKIPHDHDQAIAALSLRSSGLELEGYNTQENRLS